MGVAAGSNFRRVDGIFRGIVRRVRYPRRQLLCLSVLLVLCVCGAAVVSALLRSSRPRPSPGSSRSQPGSSSSQPGSSSSQPGSSSSLLDLTSFHYRIPGASCSADVRLLLLVTSHQGGQQRRASWRQLLTAEQLVELGARRVFLLGSSRSGETAEKESGYTSVPQSTVELESQRYGDLVQGSFTDSYRNLTYKHTMGLQWAVRRCPRVLHLLKMDDDIAVDVYRVQQLLAEYPTRGLLLGLVQYGLQPVRQLDSKWRVTPREYAGSLYPPFLSGWMYVVSMDAARALLDALRQLPVFWIDDVHVTGTAAAAAGLQLTSFNRYYTPFSEQLECCVRRRPAGRCRFLVGPTAGWPQLLAEYMQLARLCWDSGCSINATDAPDVCIHTPTRGHIVPGPGTAELVPL